MNLATEAAGTPTRHRSARATGRWVRSLEPGTVAVAAVFLALAVPVVSVLVRAVRPDGIWSLEAVQRILSSERTWRLIFVTVAQATVSCVATLLVGVPVALVLARYRFAGRGLVRTIATVPFVLPSVVIGAAIASILGPRGLADLRGTWWPIIAAHMCFNLAVVVRTVGAALASSNPDIEDAARLLGASRRDALWRVVLPVIAPAVAASAVIVFLFCLTSFGVIVVLGGGRVSTIEVEIWTRATRQFDLSGAAVLSAVQLVAVIATLWVHSRLARRTRRHLRSGRHRARAPRSTAERLRVAAALAAVGLISLLPMLALVERSLRVGDGVGLQHWTHLGSVTEGTGLTVSPLTAVLTSLATAAAATVVVVIVGLPVARTIAAHPGGRSDKVLLLPLGVSATTIGLGLLLAVGRPPLDLRRSWWIVPAAQALVAMPLMVRAVAPSLASLPRSVGDTATLLGAGPIARFARVEIPAARRAVVAGVGLAVVACLGEFGATVFVARASSPTVPVAIERLMSRPGGAGFGQAMALSTVLAVLCAAVLWVVDRTFGGDDGVAIGL